MRSLVTRLWREKLGNKMMTPQDGAELACKLEDKARDLRCYEVLIKRHPPVLSEWFVQVRTPHHNHMCLYSLFILFSVVPV